MTSMEKQRLRTGLLFVSPWAAGFLILCVYPLLSSLYFSLCDYSVLMPPVYIGLQNYRDLLGDGLFWQAVYNTAFFAAFALPLGLAVSLSLAMLLNLNLPARGVFRTVFFLPSLVPMVCLGVLWQWLLNGKVGPVNIGLSALLEPFNAALGLHLSPPNWLMEPHYAKWAVIFASLWTVGNAVVIYLSGLQDVPRFLYEAADIDGANWWQKTWHITLPVLSPVIYFNTVVGLIGSLQVFAIPYVMTNGSDGPERSLLFLSTYLYHNAFDYWNMGYACAIGVVLFLMILFLTWLGTKLSERHVYYAGK